MTSPLSRQLTALDDASTGLLAVACADPTVTSAELRLCCLGAVEQLRSVGALPSRDLHSTAIDVTVTIRSALTALDGCPGSGGARTLIAEVTQTVRDAAHELG